MGLDPQSLEYKVGIVFLRQPIRIGMYQRLISFKNPDDREVFFSFARGDFSELINEIGNNTKNMKKATELYEEYAKIVLS